MHSHSPGPHCARVCCGADIWQVVEGEVVPRLAKGGRDAIPDCHVDVSSCQVGPTGVKIRGEHTAWQEGRIRVRRDLSAAEGSGRRGSPGQAEGSFLEAGVLCQLCALLEPTSLLNTPLDFFCERSQSPRSQSTLKSKAKSKSKCERRWEGLSPEAVREWAEQVEQMRKTHRRRFSGLKRDTPPPHPLFSTVKCGSGGFDARISPPSTLFKVLSYSSSATAGKSWQPPQSFFNSAPIWRCEEGLCRRSR